VSTFTLSLVTLDESLYILVARELLQGNWPYDAVFDHKPIGLYYIFSLPLAVFSDGPLGARILGWVAVSATGTVIAAILWRQLQVSRTTALAMAICYLLAIMANEGLATNTEILINFFHVAWIGLALWQPKNPSNWRYPFIGFLMGIAFQTNYLAAFLIVGFAIGFFVVILVEKTTADWRGAVLAYVRRGASIFFGFLACNILILTPLFLFGSIDQYFHEQYNFLSSYHKDFEGLKTVLRALDELMPILPLLAFHFLGMIWLYVASAHPAMRS